MACMTARIGSSKPLKHYVREWRLARGLTQDQLADRIDSYKGQISNWENDKRGISRGMEPVLVEALGLESREDLYRHPDQPSPAELLRDPAIHGVAVIMKDGDDHMKAQLLEMAKILSGKRAS
jgi:transcriptional regulator with XRE-family HTH domain